MNDKILVFGVSSPHEGEPDKPNEDAWLFNSRSGIVAVADGVTRSRLPDGQYPAEYATFASTSFVYTILEKLNTCILHTTKSIKAAIAAANKAIQSCNETQDITKKTVNYSHRDYLATTGEALWTDGKTAILSYIGDVVGIFIPANGAPKLLTRDQLHACHQYTYGHFEGLISPTLTPQEAKSKRLTYQRKEVRNKTSACDPDGNRIGFGTLTGEYAALDFVESVELPVSAGDMFILASDALRVVATNNDNEEETIASYALVLKKTKTKAFEELPQALINLIRDCEVAKSARSDDATVVVVKVI